jgi:hypothetical protein
VAKIPRGSGLIPPRLDRGKGSKRFVGPRSLTNAHLFAMSVIGGNCAGPRRWAFVSLCEACLAEFSAVRRRPSARDHLQAASCEAAGQILTHSSLCALMTIRTCLPAFGAEKNAPPRGRRAVVCGGSHKVRPGREQECAGQPSGAKSGAAWKQGTEPTRLDAGLKRA